MSKRPTDAASGGRLILDLVDSLDQLRVIQREIGRMNNKTQIQYLMKKRQDLLMKVKSVNDELKRRVPRIDSIDLRVFQSIYHALGLYGRGVTESILLSFEYETGFLPLEIVNQPKAFYECVEKVFGKKSSKKVENAILSEISREYGLQLSKKTNLSEAIRMARTIMYEQSAQEGKIEQR